MSKKSSKTSTKVRADTHNWNNRIIGHDNIAPSEITKNDANWREHPALQMERMEGILNHLGWLDELTVNKSTGKLIDGHMRLDLAIQASEPTVPVRYVELSEDEEREALATYDTIGLMATQNRRKLKALQEKNIEKVQELRAKTDKASQGVADMMENASTIHNVAAKAIQRNQDRREKQKEKEQKDSIENTSDELPGLMELKFSKFEWEFGLNKYDIPEINLSGCSDCPEPIVVWTAPDSSPSSEYYLTVIGNGNLFNLPFENSILCGHTTDDLLDKVWFDQWSYTKKLLNRKFYACGTPEFSVGVEWSKTERIWNTFRNRYIGAYWQATGLKIIPSISHLEVDSDIEFIYDGLPQNLPCVSIQVHAHYKKDSSEDKQDRFSKTVNVILSHLSPQSILVYGDKHREEYIEFSGLREHKMLTVISVEDYATQRFRFLSERKGL